jgi:type I restriction enzyme R subunit
VQRNPARPPGRPSPRTTAPPPLTPSSTALRAQLDQRGTLDVLRRGVELLGLRQPIKLAEFKPALGINPDILARYEANRLRVVRQVRYSLHNENCIDLVLFLNGLPVATVELKTDFTQSVHDAIDQYRFDRLPHPKGQAAEPLLSFPGGRWSTSR